MITALDYEGRKKDVQVADKGGRHEGPVRVQVCDEGFNEGRGLTDFDLICHEVCLALFCQQCGQESRSPVVHFWNWNLESLLLTKL